MRMSTHTLKNHSKKTVVQVRERIHQAMANFSKHSLREREMLREMRAQYKKQIVEERGHYYAARDKALAYPNEYGSLIIDGASQEGCVPLMPSYLLCMLHYPSHQSSWRDSTSQALPRAEPPRCRGSRLC
jgi:hypothetical protein